MKELKAHRLVYILKKFNHCIKFDISISSKLVKINRDLISILSRRCQVFVLSFLIKHMSSDRQKLLSEKALSCIIRTGHNAASPPIWWMGYSAPLLFWCLHFDPSPGDGGFFSVTYLPALLSVSWKPPPLETTECCSLAFAFSRWSSFAYVAFWKRIFCYACQLSDGSAQWIGIIFGIGIGIMTLFRLICCCWLGKLFNHLLPTDLMYAPLPSEPTHNFITSVVLDLFFFFQWSQQSLYIYTNLYPVTPPLIVVKLPSQTPEAIFNSSRLQMCCWWERKTLIKTSNRHFI